MSALIRDRGTLPQSRADHIAASTIVLMVHDKTVVLVASIAGLTLHRGGLAILGEPLTDHPLFGPPLR